MTIAPKNPLFWIIILCILGFTVYKIFIHYNKDQTSTQKMEINVIKHVAKTLLQVEYMKRHNVSTDWIIDYINKKQRMPDKAEETLISNMRETYELIFDSMRAYVLDGNTKHLRHIKQCLDMQKTKIDLSKIETGFKSEKSFFDTYAVLGNNHAPLKPGTIYKCCYRLDDDYKDFPVCYIYPRVNFFDYFTPADFGVS